MVAKTLLKLFAQKAGRGLYKYKGVTYKADELTKVIRPNPETGKMLRGFVPRVEEERRLAAIGEREVKTVAKAKTIS